MDSDEPSVFLGDGVLDLTEGDSVSCGVTFEVAECFLFVGAAPGAGKVEAGGYAFPFSIDGL